MKQDTQQEVVTKFVKFGSQEIELERRKCLNCEVTFWVRPDSDQIVHSIMCGEAGQLANRNWRKQWKEKLEFIKKRRKERAERDRKLKLEREEKKIETKVDEAKKIRATLPDYAKEKECSVIFAPVGNIGGGTPTALEPLTDISTVAVLGDLSDLLCDDELLGSENGSESSPTPSADKRIPIERERLDTRTSRNTGSEPGPNGINSVQPKDDNLTTVRTHETSSGELKLTQGTDNTMQITQTDSEKNMIDEQTESELQTKELSTLRENTPQVVLVSLSSIDESLDALKSVLRSAVASATHSAGSKPSVEMVNAVCNVTKNIGTLIRLKLDIAKALKNK